MTLKKFDRFMSFEDVKKFHEDLKANLTFEDVGIGDLKTDVPTTSTLGKGKFRLIENTNVPELYYRNRSGALYKWVGTAV